MGEQRNLGKCWLIYEAWFCMRNISFSLVVTGYTLDKDSTAKRIWVTLYLVQEMATLGAISSATYPRK